MKKRTLLTGLIVGALTIGASLAIAGPALADPTPDPGSPMIITNLQASIVSLPARNVHITYNATSDPADFGNTTFEIIDHQSCTGTTTIENKEPAVNAVGAASFYVAVPATGYVEVTAYSSNGANAPLVVGPVFASDVTITPAQFQVTPDPGSDPSSGFFSVQTDNSAAEFNYQLLVDGVLTGGGAVGPCTSEGVAYSNVAPGSTITMHSVDGDFDAASFTVPGAVTPPPASTTPSTPTTPITASADPNTLAFTGAKNPVLLVSIGSALLVAGGAIYLAIWLHRRRIV